MKWGEAERDLRSPRRVGSAKWFGKLVGDILDKSR
jgi:hypothetical protein